MTVRIESQSEPIPGYRLLDRLGSGGFGEVWRAEAPGGIYKAIKFIFGDLRSPDNDLIRYAEQELKSLKRVKQVRHPYLLALDRFDIIDGRLMIVMELADCNLWDRFRECRDRGLPGIPREELLVYMAEIAEVLDLMNDQFALQHLDIKPQNLFLLHNHVKVADFGQVKDLQGVMASVTGGITPVYAAPETFDGMVSRYCDQYSLACVYQELLTGERPFDGTSMSQLLMQHLQLPPNLDPSPPCDRPALLKALAKKPEDRWANVGSFVRTLREAGEAHNRAARPTFLAGSAVAGNAVQQRGAAVDLMATEATVPQRGLGSLALETPWQRSMDDTDSHEPLVTPAPPELTGPGPLRPALVIGIGQTGLRVLQRLRFDLTERYGPPEATPALRTLYVDTDPDTQEEAGRPRPQERLAALSSGEIFPANLNRAGHYLKPRLNGRSLIEGWFDQQLLYRIPRTPHTMGVRLLGRLAFCDHYRLLVNRIQSEIELALAPEAIQLTEEQTGLCLGSNRPRVYVVAGLAGGTGSGMFLDVAYSVRGRLKRMGFLNQDIVGVFIIPPLPTARTLPLALGNTYAALTEIHHYSRGDTTFTAHYDDRFGILHDTAPPFSRTFILPGPDGIIQPSRATPSGSGVVKLPTATASPGSGKPGSSPRMPGLNSGVVQKPGSRVVPATGRSNEIQPLSAKPFADAAAFIRLQLLSPLGPATDELRMWKIADQEQPAVSVSTVGLSVFDWPRAEVIAHAAQAVSRAVLKQWVVPNLQRAREVIPARATEQWKQLGLDAETLLAHLHAAVEQGLGSRLDAFIDATTRPVVPKGWLARLPEAEKVQEAVDHLVRWFGSPAVLGQRSATAIEEAVAQAADGAAEAFAHDLRKLGQMLVEDPQFRPAAAEEMLRQLHTTAERKIDRYSAESTEAAARAVKCHESLAQHIHYRKGMRKQTPAEIIDALKGYPNHRVQAVKCHYLYQLYRAVRRIITDQLDHVVLCRQQLEQAAAVEPKLHIGMPGPRSLLPPGCPDVAEAVHRLLDSLTAEDDTQIEERVQAALEAHLGGILQACLASSSGGEHVVATVREQVRAYLDSRLGDVNFGAMFLERYPTRAMAESAIGQAYADAEPKVVGPGPWEGSAVAVVGAPAGPGGDPIRERTRCAIPFAGLPFTDSRDDLTIYREYPAVPLSAVPHLGQEGAAAYRSVPESNQCSPHSRLDVLRWHQVE
jgi:hypothetical protein